MNAAQIHQVLRAAGWPEDKVVLMAAIALAESGGNTRAYNPVPPDNSYGLWQINMIGSLGPQRRSQFGLSSNADLFDPLTNARAALAIFRQQGLRAWSTYTNGAYRNWMRQSQAAYTGGAQPAPPSGSWSQPPPQTYTGGAQPAPPSGSWSQPPPQTVDAFVNPFDPWAEQDALALQPQGISAGLLIVGAVTLLVVFVLVK